MHCKLNDEALAL